jgi:hypothetical protein
MSWTSPLTVARTTRPRPPLIDLFHEGLEKRHGRLHGFCALQHEGQLHLAAGEKVTHDAHAVQEDLVHDVERCGALLHRCVQVVLKTDPGAIDDAALQSFVEGRSSSDGPRLLDVETPSKSRRSSLSGS